MASGIKFRIETADPELHIKDLQQLICELAAYEKMPSGPKLELDQLKHDLQNRYFHAFVAILSEDYQQLRANTVVGYLIYVYVYSTWEGRHLFIEDVYVKSQVRRLGIGSALWKSAVKIAYEQQHPRIEWNVLSWNQSAIEFYNRMGSINLTQKEGWMHFRLDKHHIEKVAVQ